MRSRSTDSSGFSSSPSPVRGRTVEMADAMEDVTIASDMMAVEGLSRNVTETHIREIFGKFGTIHNVTFGRGWCRVQYETETDVEGACKYMNGGQLDGNLLECRPYKEQRRTLQSPLRSPRQRRSNSRPTESPRHRRSYSRPIDSPRQSRSYSRSRSPPRRNQLHSRTPPRRDYSHTHFPSHSRPRSRSPHRRHNRRMYSPM
ncbi:hypothetical protein PSACC_01698 [Paramicrosporidium saccamoebae]|uniref:RRM domain-containing protein n=1 Tax=Paramicrosporidium saccamoebae TaxID=1246581 RepID=A0A2H9TL71_9FUNG|nr:hypothetical protein PSACC_01698 [Paramicrosporidium saccamoebae]